MTKWFWRIVAVVIPLAAVAGIVIILLPRPAIPASVESQLTSTLLIPKTSVATVTSAKYNSSINVLTYDASVFGKSIIVSEQPTPESFIDVPAAYQKVVDQMNDYYDFQTVLGTVHLTTPTNLSGLQTAVLSTDGTLVFAKPSANLSSNQWRQFFDSFFASR